MKIEKILVTGDQEMIERHIFLFQAMAAYNQTIETIDYLPINSQFNIKKVKNFFKNISSTFPFLPIKPASSLRKNSRTYIKQSYNVEQQIRKLKHPPDLVFQLFGMFCPFWQKFDIPYIYCLDYTMALAKRNWTTWAPFKSEIEYISWIDCERIAYQNARHLFTYSTCVKTSLAEDYGIEPRNISVVNSSGQFQKPYQGEKSFGSKQILFNGSHFERKGGDILLNAFSKVKQAIPEAKLIIVGNPQLRILQDGVSTIGYVSWPSEIEKLFLNTDLVVSPARCEPFGHFLVEAMNYGIPCIVTAQDGMTEIVENEVSGIVLEQQNLNLLADKIIYLLTDSSTWQKMSKNARYKVSKQFTWNVVASKILLTLENI